MNFLLHLLVISVIVSNLSARSIEDFYAQEVTVPDKVESVFGSSPPMNYLIYAINPKKMIGLNFSAKNSNNFATSEFLDEYFLLLPVVGSFHGGGKNINLEVLMAKKPDLILVWEDDMMMATVSKSIQKTHLPTLTIPFRKIEDMPKAISVAADAMNEQGRGVVLSSYTQNIISEIQTSLLNTKPVRYYYAEGVDGLSTECDQSFHVEALNFAGGENVHKCKQSQLLGLEKINFETLLTYDPDVIIAQNSFTYNQILYDDLFAHLRAVKNKKVYLVPSMPFNWVDRPPSFMRIIGIEWLTHIFHPNEYKIDLNERIKEFYELFLGVKITDKQVKTILGEE